MKILKTAIFVTLSFGLVFFQLGCDVIETQSNEGEDLYPELQTELGLLPKIISLPRTPKNVLWKYTEIKGRDNANVVALLRFTEEDYNYIVENSEKMDVKINAVFSKEFHKQWMPKQLRGRIRVIDRGEHVELLGISPLNVGLFNKTELSPLKNGNIYPLGEGFIIVNLEAS